ncbi:MarR family winged helix-turn-helix transcriptional regulator [Pantanalinema rosaneae CENA516]|uniref:MarR family winged helix-turn-helix transcriptional regulator n=1 Tax=Pantanalinema rosaneae TaxID=1620701 RepID=UPI003D6EEA4D
MSSDQLAQTVTPKHCATELMDTILPIMQFIRTEMRSQNAALLSVPQFRVLAFLNIHPGASLSDVAEHLGVTRATASAMTDRLVQRGFIDRAERPQERRHIALKLTDVGSAQLEQSQEKTRDQIATLLNNLTDEQLSSVSAGLGILKEIFAGAEIGRERVV